MVRIVGRDDHRETLSRHLPDPLQDPVLVAVIQVGRRLIKEDDLRLLHDGPGDQHLLTLAAADVPVGFLRQMPDPHALQHRKACGLILRLRAAEDPHLRGPAHQHEVQHPVIKCRGVQLGHVACDAGDILFFHSLQGFAEEADPAALRLQQSRHAVQQRSLACPVGTQDAEDLAFAQVQARLVQHLPVRARI